ASAGTQAQASPRVFAEASGGASSGASGEASAGAQALGSSRVFAEVSGEASREASAGAQAQASPQASVSRSVSGAPLPDSRTLGNVRADVLADLFGPSGPFANARSISGSRPRLMVHITAAALLGLARTPGELVGYGPIPASLARAVAQDATWQAMFTDPGSGRLVDIGARHLPPGLASEPAATLTGPGSGSGQSAGAPTEPNTEPSFEVSGAAPHVALALTDPQTAQSPRAPELTRGEGAPAPTARQPVNCESVESPQDSGAVNCEPAGLSQVSPMAQPSRPAEVSPPGRGLPPEQPPPTHPAAPVSPEAPTCPTCRRPIVGSVDSIDNPPFPVPPDLWPAETMFSNSYTPSGRLQELLAIRQPACVFPGCRAPAWRSDIDHHNPYTAGQPAQTQTTAANLGPACRADHQLKTHAGWTATRDSATGVVTITTAMGRVYRQLPPTPCTPPWSYPTH
ncbi:MAG: HNH endonuclease, partial [Bifidobacteriaceae bacterium]|nr:HNH endonuclease [Bifidobacteriaceae bacterium]